MALKRPLPISCIPEVGYFFFSVDKMGRSFGACHRSVAPFVGDCQRHDPGGDDGWRLIISFTHPLVQFLINDFVYFRFINDK